VLDPEDIILIATAVLISVAVVAGGLAWLH
jgi:hypothetical protein